MKPVSISSLKGLSWRHGIVNVKVCGIHIVFLVGAGDERLNDAGVDLVAAKAQSGRISPPGSTG